MASLCPHPECPPEHREHDPLSACPWCHYDPLDPLDARAQEMLADPTSLANRITERIPQPNEGDERPGYWRDPLRKHIARALALIEIEGGP